MRAPCLTLTALSLTTLAPAALCAQFGSQSDVATVPTPLSLQLFDIDDDGDLDIVASYNNGISTVENLEFGGFGQPQALATLTTFTFYGSIQVADLDGDGRSDIVAADIDQDRITWFRSTGVNSFALEAVLVDVNNPRDFRLADLDGDGDLDLVATRESFSSDRILTFENLGAATFADAVEIATNVNDPRDVEVADFDGDGVLDIASVSFADDRIAWYRGLGAGTFGPQMLISTAGDGPNRLEAADFDGDGLMDLAVVSFSDNEVNVFRNTGGGFANAFLIDNAAGGATRLTTGDMDRDGDIDIIVGCNTSNEVRTYENIGFGFFGAPVVLDGLKSGAVDVALGDLDGDADVDILSSATNRIFANFQTAELGSTYCTSNPNSTGVDATIAVTGTANLDFDELALTVTEMPASSFGFFITSQTQGMVNMPSTSQGVLCVLGQIGRYVDPGQLQFSGVNSRIRLRVDANTRPSPNGLVPVIAGQTWNFQAWFRDMVGGVNTSNFSSAVAVTFN